MSIDYDDAYNRAREGDAFSNGTQWEIWEANWCDSCLRDAPFRRGMTNIGCPLVLIAFVGRIPAEWIEQPDDSPDEFHCIEYRAPGSGGSGEPKPQPDPPGMDELFPRPGPVVRMYVQPELTPVRSVETVTVGGDRL